MGAVDVVWCVADYDELFRREIHLQMFADAISRACGKIATIVLLLAKRARQGEEAVETD